MPYKVAVEYWAKLAEPLRVILEIAAVPVYVFAIRPRYASAALFSATESV
jgi:hypothetical protein